MDITKNPFVVIKLQPEASLQEIKKQINLVSNLWKNPPTHQKTDFDQLRDEWLTSGNLNRMLLENPSEREEMRQQLEVAIDHMNADFKIYVDRHKDGMTIADYLLHQWLNVKEEPLRRVYLKEERLKYLASEMGVRVVKRSERSGGSSNNSAIDEQTYKQLQDLCANVGVADIFEFLGIRENETSERIIEKCRSIANDAKDSNSPQATAKATLQRAIRESVNRDPSSFIAAYRERLKDSAYDDVYQKLQASGGGRNDTVVPGIYYDALLTAMRNHSSEDIYHLETIIGNMITDKLEKKLSARENKCVHCGKMNPLRNLYCSGCSRILYPEFSAEDYVCPNPKCKNSVSRSAHNYCGSCGNKILT